MIWPDFRVINRKGSGVGKKEQGESLLRKLKFEN